MAILDCGPASTRATDGILLSAGPNYDVMRGRLYDPDVPQVHCSFAGPNLNSASVSGRAGIHADAAGGAAGTTNVFLVVAGSGASWTLYEHKVSDGTVNRSKLLTLPAGTSSMTCHDVVRIGTRIWVNARASDGKTYLLLLDQNDLDIQTPVDTTSGTLNAVGPSRLTVDPDPTSPGPLLAYLHPDGSTKIVVRGFSPSGILGYSIIYANLPATEVLGIASDPVASVEPGREGVLWILYKHAVDGKPHLARIFDGFTRTHDWEAMPYKADVRAMTWDAGSGSSWWNSSGRTYVGTFALLAKYPVV